MRSTFVDIDGPVHLADFGGSGRPIVLLHGIEGSHVNFLAVVEGLADHGRVFAVDLLGHGFTPPAGRRCDLRTNRRMLVRLLRDVVGEPAVVAGTSLGGLLAMLVAGAAPDLVDALVLIGPGQPYPKEARVNWAFAVRHLAVATPVLGPVLADRHYRRDPDEKAAHALSFVCYDDRRVPHDVRRQYVAMAHQRARMPWAADVYVDTVRSLVRELPRDRGYVDYIRGLKPPTLLVHGEEDDLVVPEASLALARLRPDWRLVMLPQVGHSPQLEVPDRLVDIMGGWLAEAAPGNGRVVGSVGDPQPGLAPAVPHGDGHGGDGDGWMTLAEAGRLAGTDRRRLAGLCRSGQLPVRVRDVDGSQEVLTSLDAVRIHFARAGA